MLDIIIITIGGLKEDYFRKGVEEYAKRMRPYMKLEARELSTVPFDSHSRERSKDLEADKILEALDKLGGRYIIICDENGKKYDSTGFAAFLEKRNQPLAIVIGGSLGLGKKVKERADAILSMSELTFPHELARLVLYEQLYRATTIINHKTYHY